MGWDVNVPWHFHTKNGTQALAHIHVEPGVGWGSGVGWDVNVPWHLHTKNSTQALAHIHVEPGVG